MESVEYRNISFTIWDVGGQDKIRPLWAHYFSGTQAVIFVVDSNDTERFELAAHELHQLMSNEELSHAVVLIFCNKQDLPGAAKTIEVQQALRLGQIRCEWYIQPCVATTGDGLYEGLEWLSEAVSRSNK